MGAVRIGVRQLVAFMPLTVLTKIGYHHECFRLLDRMIDWIKHGIEKMVPQPDVHANSKTEIAVKGAVRINSPWQPPVPDCDALVVLSTAASATSEPPAAAIPADTEQ